MISSAFSQKKHKFQPRDQKNPAKSRVMIQSTSQTPLLDPVKFISVMGCSFSRTGFHSWKFSVFAGIYRRRQKQFRADGSISDPAVRNGCRPGMTSANLRRIANSLKTPKKNLKKWFGSGIFASDGSRIECHFGIAIYYHNGGDDCHFLPF